MESEGRIGERMVLPKESTLEEVASLAEHAGFDDGPKQQNKYTFEKVWMINDQLTLHYIYDDAINISYIMVMGEIRADVQYAIGLVRTLLSAPDVPQLMAAVEEARGREEKASAIMRLAIGMPISETPPDALRVLLNSFTDGDSAIRKAALVSALFLDWEVVRPYVVKLEKEDPVEQLRHEARFFLATHRSEGPK